MARKLKDPEGRNVRRFCIDAVEGETVGGWFSRIVARFPIRADFLVQSMTALSNAGGALNPVLPSGVRELAASVPPGHRFSDAEVLVHHHTAFRYVTYFAGKEYKELAHSRVLHGRTRGHYGRSMGMARYPIDAYPARARFCLECITDDWQKLGFPIYHLEHQLPAVGYCWIHEAPLYIGCAICGRRFLRAKAINMPGDCPHHHRDHYIPAFNDLPRSSEPLLWLARASAHMVRSGIEAESGLDALFAAAYERVPSTKYVGSCNCSDLSALVERRFGTHVLQWLNSSVGVNATTGSRWPQYILNRRKAETKNAPSLRLLIILGALFEDVPEFEENVPRLLSIPIPEAKRMRGREVGFDDAKRGRQKHPGKLKRHQVEASVKKFGINLRLASKALGVPLTRYRSAIIYYEIAVPRVGRAFQWIGERRYQAALKAARAGVRKEDITKRYNLSWYQVEMLAMWEPGLHRDWKAGRGAADLQRAKVLIERCLKAGVKTRSEAQKAQKGAYLKLLLRDPDWLDGRFPKRKYPVGRQTKYAESDEKLVKKIHAFVHPELQSGKSPRLTATFILRELKVVGSYQRLKRLGKVPKTDQLLAKVTEDKNQFYLRRLKLAANSLLARGALLNRRTLQRESTLGHAKVCIYFDEIVRIVGYDEARAIPAKRASAAK